MTVPNGPANAYRKAVIDEAQAELDRTLAIKDASQALQDLNLQLREEELG